MGSNDGRHMTKIGELPSDWRVERLGQLCEVLDNDRVPIRAQERAGMKGDIPYYGANGVVDYIDRWIYDEPLLLLAEDGGNFDDFATRPIAYLIDGKSWVNNHAHVLRAKKPNDLRYLYYTLANRDIRSYINGTTRTKLNQADMRSVRLPIPPIEEQKGIARALQNIDTAIERTRAVIDQVRVVKQALLADLMTNGLPGRHKKFKTVKGIGRTPSNWRVVLFEEAIKRITYGFTNPMPTTDEGPYMVTAKNIEDGYINYAETRRTDWDDYHALLSDKSRPSIDDVLLTKDGTLGRVALVDRDDVCVNQSVAVITPLPSTLSPTFLYWMLQSRPWQEALTRDASGSGLQHIYITKVAKLRVGLPDGDEQAAISQAMGKVEARLVAEREYLCRLTRSKSALSDALLTGRVRVIKEKRK